MLITPSTITENPHSYLISDGPDEYTHSAFTLTFSPADHNLCGPLLYRATFDSGSTFVSTSDEPFAYDGTQLKYTINTEDNTMYSGLTKPFTIYAEFD